VENGNQNIDQRIQKHSKALIRTIQFIMLQGMPLEFYAEIKLNFKILLSILNLWLLIILQIFKFMI
jgi:hypothetical protein